MKVSAFFTLCIAAVRAGLDFDEPPQYISSSARPSNAATNVIEPANFNLCSCDLTPGACDAECCCDTDCPEGTIEAWTLANYCDNETAAGATLAFDQCMKRYQEPRIDDLRGGLNIYEKVFRSLLCTQTENTRKQTAKFQDESFQASSNADFEAIKTEYETMEKLSYSESSSQA